MEALVAVPKEDEGNHLHMVSDAEERLCCGSGGKALSSVGHLRIAGSSWHGTGCNNRLSLF